MKRGDCTRLAANIGDLPSLPHVVTQVIRLVEDPTTSAAQVSQAVNTDQSLTAKVLRLANSAYYGFPYQISTVAHASVIIGFRAVKTLVISAFASAWFDARGDAINRQELWKHSVGCAVAARLLASRAGWTDAEEAFTAGLLHDIGRVMLDRYAHSLLREAVERSCADHIALREAECEVFGFTHSELGRYVAEQWKFPTTLCTAIGYHHDPLEAPAHVPLLCAVAGGELLCAHLGVGEDNDPMPPHAERAVLDALKMSAEDLSALADPFWAQWERVTEILGLAVPAAKVA